ncbi:TonB-dependent receptor plug domain-containing protein [Desulfotignum balticum]|uniref:TonB-dependent receptor plug domain-containing protein n=1 Tax=Desulfotignum balticum TaxID=115781 RepID=UPI000462673C|nr:TonB-dependent receptor [Desulfotignum balticum]
MKPKKWYVFGIVLWLYIGMSLAMAAEDAKQPSTTVYSLGEVVVSADSPENTPVKTVEITAEDIEKRHALTLAKALELLPGVDIRRGGEGVPRVNIRGFRSRHTILLLNGIPMNSTYDSQFDPNMISTENIAKIKVSYGGHSVLYGQGGLAGVINIITKQGTTGLGGDVSAEMDENGNHYTKLNVGGGNDKVSFFGAVNNYDSDGFHVSDNFDPTSQEDGNERNNSDSERLSLFGNLVYQMTDEIEMGLTLERTTGEYGTPPMTVDDKKDPFYKKPKYDRTEDLETLSGQVSMSYTPKGMFGFRGWVFANTNDQENARYDDDTYSTMTKKNTYQSNDETKIKGAAFQTRADFGTAGNAVLGLSTEASDYTSDFRNVDKDNVPPTAYYYDHGLDMYSAALEYNVRLLSKLGVTAGYSHHWQTKDEGSDVDKGSYMAGLSYDLTDSTILRASYARKIRFPDIKQLYDPKSGNADLVPEESKNYEAGITQRLFGDMTLDLAVFKHDVSQYIEKNDATELYKNWESYEFKGFEIYLFKPFLTSGTIGLGYSYLDTEDKSAGAQRDELQYRPAHKYTLDVGYTWDFGLRVHADILHTADQYYYSDNFDKGKLKDYTLVNVKLEQKVYKDSVFLYLGLDNLTDENYEESYGLPQAGRTGYAGIRMTF